MLGLYLASPPDELSDLVFVRPAAWTGRFAQQTFERLVVDGLFVGGPVALVRAGSEAVAEGVADVVHVTARARR